VGKQNVKAELFYDGTWHDLVADEDVFTSAPITITQGLADEQTLRPGSATLQLDNGDDTYRTSNPESPLYGKIGRNTPLRITVGSTVRSVTEAAKWSSDSTDDFRRSPRRGKAWTDVSGDGLLARLGRWSEPLRSPMVRQAQSLPALTGLWPMDDPSDATILSSALPAAAAATIAGDVTTGATDRPAGASASVQLGTTSNLSGRFAGSSNSGWQVSFACRVPALPTTGASTWYDLISFTDTVGRRWAWKISQISHSVEATDAAGNILATNAFTFGSPTPDRWTRYLIKVTPTGVDFRWYQQDDLTGFVGTITYAAATGALATWNITSNAITSDAWYSTLHAVDDTSLDLTNSANVKSAFNGYRGETARPRFRRLMTELGLAYTEPTVTTTYTSRAMGAQPAATIVDLLTEIATTEDAILTDTPDSIGLTLMSRGYRYRQTPITLTPTDFPSLPKEVEASADAHNVVTASQRDGADSTAEDVTGPLGTAVIGEQRETVDVNVADQTLLPQIANWWLRRGTVNLPKYPTVEINLAALSPARVAVIETIVPGSVIEIAGFRENTIRLYVLGWREVIGTHTRTITLNCAPDRQFQVGKWDATDSRWDSPTTTLKTAVNSSATDLTFRCAFFADRWSQNTPYDVMIAGERVTVTAMGAAAPVAGGYDQAVTVVRHVNGITKALPASSPVSVATPGRWAL
jgi:hypothetical protein